MKARDILGAMFGLAALTFVLASHAQEPQKNDKKADRAAELREDLALREQILARQFAEFEQALLKLKYRLERSPKQEDKDRAVVLGKVLDESRTKGIGVQFDAIVEQLKHKNLGSLPEIKAAADRSTQLANDLQALVKLLKEDSRVSKLAEEGKRLREQIKELEAIIHNQKIVQAQTEIGKTDKNELGKNQKTVTERTEKLLKELDGKGGEAKNMKGNAKEAKGKGKDGEGKDTGKSGEAKAGEAKDGGKEGAEGKQGEAKSGEGKEGKEGGKEGDEGKSGEAKSGEAKDGSGKEGASKGGEAKDSKSGEGKSGEGKEGKGGDGKEGAPKSGEGKSGEAKEGAGKSGEAKAGEPKAGGEPKNGKAGEGKPSAEAKSGKGGEAKGGEAKDSKSGKGGDGKSGEAKSGKGGEGGEAKQGEAKSGQGGESSAKDSGGPKSPPQSGAKGGDGKSPPPGQQADKTPGKKQIEDGNYKQKEAEDNIAGGKNKDAGDKQGGAVRDLENAKKKLEDLLRQVREEELERLLAALQARCEKMLAMQIEVLAGTEGVAKAIAENPKKETTREHKQDALRLSDREGEIVLEASKAIEMLEAEGSAVAFPEVFQQVREDMKSVQRRLGTADAGNLTQDIEKDIIASLKEMIDALKKAKQELDDKKSPPPGPPGPPPPPQDQKLLDQIAELKMIRSMQIRVNTRTTSIARNIEQGKEQATDPNLRRDLNIIAERQERIYDITNRIAKGDNK